MSKSGKPTPYQLNPDYKPTKTLEQLAEQYPNLRGLLPPTPEQRAARLRSSSAAAVTALLARNRSTS